ncbi:MAG: hypothetical protein ACTHNT_10710 [Actinomycetales bacterium]
MSIGNSSDDTKQTKFVGWQALPQDNEVIEVVISGVRYDLHNDSQVQSLKIFQAQGRTSVLLTLLTHPLKQPTESTYLDFAFKGISEVMIEADGLTPAHEPDLFVAFSYDGRNGIGIETGCLVVELHVNEARATVRTSPH